MSLNHETNLNLSVCSHIYLFPAIGKIVLQLFFYKDGFGFKYPKRVDMPLNKETKSDLFKVIISSEARIYEFLE